MSVSTKKHDVFISFRGEDIRKTFMPQLHQALKMDNIKTYIDYNLEKGEKIGPSLSQAIKESHISVVVFSENYADSKWCLEELVQVLKCREHDGQIVIPVFYETDPSDVRKQKGSYETPFARYEAQVTDGSNFGNIVCGWRAALNEAAGISGYHSSTYRDDSELINNIVKDVWRKLSLLYPNESKDLVQIDEMNKYIESLLRRCQRIGIWGMGGMGKTTIAEQMFSNNFAQYDSVCFLKNVREESMQFGATHLRTKLFSELLKRPITESDVVGLHNFIKVRLNSKKVFIVLDDVDDIEQLEDLCRELGDLGQESKLIITTRNRDVLNGRVDEIYEVTNWKLEESKMLFCLHAFKQSHPKVRYECLSDRAVAYAGGIPLALKVLGSYFHSHKDLKFWESKLNYLEKKEESLDKVQNVLRVSYDGLSRSEKDIFLDIAFFFKDKYADFVTKILDACNFNATCGLQILVDKALITIPNKRIQMHDLLQEMAFNIVRYKNGRASGDQIKRSRLRDTTEVRDILMESHDEVEGIMFDISRQADLHVRFDTFNRMTKLRFFNLYAPSGMERLTSVSIPEDFMPFSEKLRYFVWNGYPLKSLPQPFSAEMLVEIRLPYSNVEHLWHDVQELVNLEAIDLRECKQLIKLPNLSAAPKLKCLYLSGCESLCEVQLSILSKDTLRVLMLDRCTKLQSLMSEKHLTSLRILSVYGCISLKEFSLYSSWIYNLDLRKTRIEILHPSIGDMSKLHLLNLEGLMLQSLPREMSRLSSLRELWLSYCSIVTKSNLEAIFDDGLKSLKILHLRYCCNLFELPNNIGYLASLSELRLDGSNVRMLSTSIKHLSELTILSLDNCIKLCCLPELPTSIKVICANNCTSLVTTFTLKILSVKFQGGKRFISFMNNSKTEMDELSLNRIMEEAILLIKDAAYENRARLYDNIYNSFGICLTGSMVPRQFQYRTIDSSSITIEIDSSKLLGLIFSIVVSPSHERMVHIDNSAATFQFQCYLQDGSEVGCASLFHQKAFSNLNMDHVFIWYDPFQFNSLRGAPKRKISFEFRIISNNDNSLFRILHTIRRKEEKLDALFCIKECGICPIYCSEFPMNLDNDSKLEVYDGDQLKSESLENYEEREDNGIKLLEIGDEKPNIDTSTEPKNQELDLNGKSHHSYDSLIGTRVNDNTLEKEDRDDDGSSTKFKKSNILHESSTKSQEKIETSFNKRGLLEKEEEDYIGGSENAKSSFKKAMMLKSKGNEEISTESDAKMHLPVVSVKENASDCDGKSRTTPSSSAVEAAPKQITRSKRKSDCIPQFSKYNIEEASGTSGMPLIRKYKGVQSKEQAKRSKKTHDRIDPPQDMELDSSRLQLVLCDLKLASSKVSLLDPQKQQGNSPKDSMDIDFQVIPEEINNPKPLAFSVTSCNIESTSKEQAQATDHQEDPNQALANKEKQTLLSITQEPANPVNSSSESLKKISHANSPSNKAIQDDDDDVLQKVDIVNISEDTTSTDTSFSLDHLSLPTDKSPPSLNSSFLAFVKQLENDPLMAVDDFLSNHATSKDPIVKGSFGSEVSKPQCTTLEDLIQEFQRLASTFDNFDDPTFRRIFKAPIDTFSVKVQSNRDLFTNKQFKGITSMIEMMEEIINTDEALEPIQQEISKAEREVETHAKKLTEGKEVLTQLKKQINHKREEELMQQITQLQKELDELQTARSSSESQIQKIIPDLRQHGANLISSRTKLQQANSKKQELTNQMTKIKGLYSQCKDTPY